MSTFLSDEGLRGIPKRDWTGFFSTVLNSYLETSPSFHNQDSLGEAKLRKISYHWAFCLNYTSV